MPSCINRNSNMRIYIYIYTHHIYIIYTYIHTYICNIIIPTYMHACIHTLYTNQEPGISKPYMLKQENHPQARGEVAPGALQLRTPTLTLRLKIAQRSYIVWSLGPKALGYESLEPKSKILQQVSFSDFTGVWGYNGRWLGRGGGGLGTPEKLKTT